MALSNATTADVVVQFEDQGSVDGSPTAFSSTAVTTKCRRVTVSDRLTKTIDVSGFGTAQKFRPGKTSYEITLEMLVAHTGGPVTAVVGNYGKVEYTVGGASEVQVSSGVIISNELDMSDDNELIQRIVIQGPADQ